MLYEGMHAVVAKKVTTSCAGEGRREARKANVPQDTVRAVNHGNWSRWVLVCRLALRHMHGPRRHSPGT